MRPNTPQVVSTPTEDASPGPSLIQRSIRIALKLLSARSYSTSPANKKKGATAEALHPRVTQVTDESDVVVGACIPVESLSRLIDEVVEVRKRNVEGGCRDCALRNRFIAHLPDATPSASDHQHRTGCCAAYTHRSHRFSSTRECPGIVQTHNPNPPIPLDRSASIHKPPAETARALPHLKAYKLSTAQGITAQVDGFQNVGENSLINALGRAKVRHCICRAGGVL